MAISLGILTQHFQVQTHMLKSMDESDERTLFFGQVLVRKAGRDVEEYEGVWPRQRMPGQLINVARPRVGRPGRPGRRPAIVGTVWTVVEPWNQWQKWQSLA